jgi:type IV pilus assembly protein PilZ
MADRDGETKRDPADRRTDPRQAVTLVVEYEGVEDLIADYTENLSRGGTFVHTERRLEEDTRVQLVLSFPGLLKPLCLLGVVRWTRAEDDQPGVGIEFEDHDETAQARLATIIQAIERRDREYVGRLLKILVVEDNPHVARLIRDGLGHGVGRQFGNDLAFKFRVCNNGRDALDLLHHEEFDALIIDIYLPVLDGPAVISQIRADPRLTKLPIIAVSAGGQSARESAMEAGADFFLDKPMRLRQVIDSMRKLLQLRR